MVTSPEVSWLAAPMRRNVGESAEPSAIAQAGASGCLDRAQRLLNFPSHDAFTIEQTSQAVGPQKNRISTPSRFLGLRWRKSGYWQAASFSTSWPRPPMKSTRILLLAAIIVTTVPLHAQVQSPSPAATATPVADEPLLTLNDNVTQAAKQAAEVPINVARDLVTNPASTSSSAT
jgi:hypothetical protein